MVDGAIDRGVEVEARLLVAGLGSGHLVFIAPLELKGTANSNFLKEYSKEYQISDSVILFFFSRCTTKIWRKGNKRLGRGANEV